MLPQMTKPQNSQNGREYSKMKTPAPNNSAKKPVAKHDWRMRGCWCTQSSQGLTPIGDSICWCLQQFDELRLGFQWPQICCEFGTLARSVTGCLDPRLNERRQVDIISVWNHSFQLTALGWHETCRKLSETVKKGRSKSGTCVHVTTVESRLVSPSSPSSVLVVVLRHHQHLHFVQDKVLMWLELAEAEHWKLNQQGWKVKPSSASM